ncbi:phosphatase PAP2 family protein [Streptomyces sp. NPDC049954]|uniref:phosphatase PAP2 family protein n=1 Tax=Streptomyces sp. NPDC049954 TaxID=3155779 RepID=UPI00342DE1F6
MQRTEAPVADTGPAGVTRLRWWTEIPLLLLVYGAYSAGRLVARGDVAQAVDHGLAILRVEKFFRINAEHPLNRLFTREPWLGIPADFWYASLHYVVTPAVLVWLFRYRTAVYRAGRTWLMTSTMIGLIGFTLLPTCPPRLLAAGHGFVDTMAHYSSYGWWGGEASAPRGLGGMTNQYAAMPSLHVGWALWCGVMLWRHGRSRWARAAGIVYPLVTTLVVMGTANHYLLDALAGVAVMGAGALLSRPVLRWAGRVRVRLGGAAEHSVLVARSPVEGASAGTGKVPGASPVAVREPVVGGGCETSAGERIPQQHPLAPGADRGRGPAPAERPDGAPAAAR